MPDPQKTFDDQQIDPDNPVDISRLVRAHRVSYKELLDFRNLRREFLRYYLGAKDPQGMTVSVAVNLVEQFVNIYQRNLVPNSPAPFVSVSSAELLGTRSKLELGLEYTAKRIDLEETLRLCVFDALFSVAHVKIGIDETVPGAPRDPGRPFVEHVELGNWCHDMSATKWKNVRFMGDKSRIPLEEARDRYPEFADELTPTLAGDTQESEEQDEPIPRAAREDIEFRDLVDIWQLFLPDENLIVEMPAGPEGLKALLLAVEDWQGPDVGPYRRLAFTDVVGRTMPLSPIAVLFELAKLHGALWRKSSTQAKEQKTVIAAKRSNVKDAGKIVHAGDLEVVTTDGDPNLVKDFRLGGADPGTIQMEDLVRNLFSEFAGNLQLLGGLSPQSETATQDRMLAASASQRLKSMQASVKGLTRDVFRDLGWWLWGDPTIDLPLSRRTPGTGQSISIKFTPEDRKGEYFDYNIEVNPYSMQSRTPEEEFQLLMFLYANIIVPGEQQMAQQGVIFNFPAFLRRIAKLKNLDTMDEFLMFTGGVAPGPKATGSPPPILKMQEGGNRSGQPAPDRDFQKTASMMRMLAGNRESAA